MNQVSERETHPYGVSALTTHATSSFPPCFLIICYHAEMNKYGTFDTTRHAHHIWPKQVDPQHRGITPLMISPTLEGDTSVGVNFRFEYSPRRPSSSYDIVQDRFSQRPHGKQSLSRANGADSAKKG